MAVALTARITVHTSAAWSDSFDFRKGITTRDLVDSLSRETWMDDDNAEPCRGDCADMERGRRCGCSDVPTGIGISIRPRVVKAVKAPSDDLFGDDDLEDLPF